jgi:fucose permease
MQRVRLAVAFGFFILIGINLAGGGVLLPAQIDDYGVDKATIGLVFPASSLGYGIAAAANGALMHRLGVRLHLMVGATVMAAAAAAIALHPPFALFILLQGALGLGVGALEACLNAYLSTLDRATALLNYLHAFFGVGALSGPGLAATMLEIDLSWTVFYALIAVLVVPLLIGVLVLYPASSSTVDDAPPRLSRALAHRAAWLGGAFLALYVGVEIGVGNWSFTFLTEERGHGLVLAGWAVSGYWTGLTVGRFVLGPMADRLRIGVVGLIAACLAGTAASALVIWLVPGAAIVGLMVMGFCLGPMYPTMIAVVPRLVPPALVATVIGVVVSLSVGGGALFPWLAGGIAQRYGTWSLFPLSLALTALVGVVWWLIARRLAASAAPAEKPVPAGP